MNVFEAVKNSVSTRLVAEYYGLRINRNGMACCPFHDDRTPSLKVDNRYHCFGCQADGDAIDYVANLYGLGPKDAAFMIAKDFGINYDSRTPPGETSKWSEPVKMKSLYRQFNDTRKRFWQVITDYYHLLCFWREAYAPMNPDEEWDDRFTEALGNITLLEYIMDAFLEGGLETQVDIINDYGGRITYYERQIDGSACREAGKADPDDPGDETGRAA